MEDLDFNTKIGAVDESRNYHCMSSGSENHKSGSRNRKSIKWGRKWKDEPYRILILKIQGEDRNQRKWLRKEHWNQEENPGNSSRTWSNWSNSTHQNVQQKKKLSRVNTVRQTARRGTETTSRSKGTSHQKKSMFLPWLGEGPCAWFRYRPCFRSMELLPNTPYFLCEVNGKGTSQSE